MALKIDDAIRQLIDQILGNRDEAVQFALNPGGSVAAQGVEGGYPVDVRQIVSDYCNDPSVPYDTRQALQSYTSGQSGPPGPAHSQAEVVQQLQHVTYVTYENDEQITNIIDQSRDVFNNTDINVGDDFEGDINVDNATATGDRAAAGNVDGDGDLNQVTGDGSQVLTGDDATGNTGDHSNVVGADADVSAPLIAGDNSGIVADGDVDDSIVGDGNRVLNADGAVAGPINFGDGAVTGSSLTNSQGVVGGDAVNTSGNTVGTGGSLSGVGDSHGGDVDQSVHTTTITETSTIDADHSIVGTEQGDGDFDQHGEHADFLPRLEPVRLSESDGPDDGLDD
jgi:hypothetical protein